MATADVSSSPRAATAARSRRRPRGAVKSSARLQSTVAAISLLALVGTSLLVVVIAAQRPSFLTPLSEHGYFPDWMAGPLRGLWPSLTSSGNRLAWLVSALLAGMFVIYLLAVANAKRLDARWTIAAIVAVHLIFLLAPPLSYTDVFNYVNYGRMGVVHHLNPYTTTPLLEPHDDPSFLLSNWHHLLSPYGPVFTLFTYALVPLGVVASFWIMKLLVGLASLTLLALVWRCACALGRNPTSAIALVGLNPIVLVWGLGADHNDSLMIAFVVLGAYLLIRAPQASRGAGAALVAAVFIKASAAVLLPVFLLAGERRRFAVGAAAAAAVLGAASLIAFGPHPPDISTQSQLVAALSLPNLFGLALGLGGETAGVRLLFEAALIVAIGGCAIWAARRPDEWLTAAGTATIALLISLGWAGPWYLLWVLPFAALSRSRRLGIAVVALGVYFILAYMPATPMLAKAIDFHPESTALGIAHQQETEALVR